MKKSVVTRRSLIQIGAAVLVMAESLPAQTSQTPTDAQKVAPKSQSGLTPRLTMHAIDTFHGTPGAGLKCTLSMLDTDTYRPLKTVLTSPDGRTEAPLLSESELKSGRYELELDLESYFRDKKVTLPNEPFLTQVPIRFVIADVDRRYHLPVLFTPWGYSYYRGS